MNPALAMPDAPPARRRGRLQLLLILMVVIGPMVLASAMYKFQFWVPEGRSFHGTLIGNGLMTAACLVAAETLAAEGIQARVIDMPTVKPLDEEIVARAAAETGGIVVAEEHLVRGALGAAVAQAACRTRPCPIEFVGLEDTYAESGAPAALMQKYGLTWKEVEAAARRLLARTTAGAAR